MRNSDVVLLKNDSRWMLYKTPDGRLFSGGPESKVPARLEFPSLKEAAAKGWRTISLKVYLRAR